MNKSRQTARAAKSPAELLVVTTKSGDATNYPKRGATCRIHYEGRLSDGSLFDSSRARAQPLLFKLGVGQLIKGLDQAIVKMSVGQVCTITVPPHLGYGAAGYLPVIPPNATLKYEVELITFDLDEDEEEALPALPG